MPKIVENKKDGFQGQRAFKLNKFVHQRFLKESTVDQCGAYATAPNQLSQILFKKIRQLYSKLIIPFRMIRTDYVMVEEQRYAPINVIPSSLIKCTHCDLYIPHERFQSHSQDHLPLKFKEASATTSKPTSALKIDLKKVLELQESDEEITVKSFLPQELPGSETQRPQIGHLFKNASNFSTNFPKLDSFKPELSYCKISSPIGQPLITDSEFKQLKLDSQSQSPLSFKKSIRLQPQMKEITTKKLNYYTNQKPLSNGRYSNEVVVRAKNPTSPEGESCSLGKQNSQFYLVEPIQAKKQSKLPVKIEIKSTFKSPRHQQKISTVSSTTGEGFFKEAYTSCPRDLLEVQKQNECPQCKGFYCQTCKSDIPPIYRQMPGSEAQFVQSDSRVFYASHISHRSYGKTSRLTGCSNCE